MTPKLGRVLIDELLEDVANDYRMNDHRSSEYLGFRIKQLLPVFGGRKAADITTADIRRYIVSRQSGASQEQITAELARLQKDYGTKVETMSGPA